MADELDDALREAAERWAAPERHGIPPADRARAHRLPPEAGSTSWVSATDLTGGWDMDRHRHLWEGEWKDPEPPGAGQVGSHELEFQSMPSVSRIDRWRCRRCTLFVYAVDAEGRREVWGPGFDVACSGEPPRRRYAFPLLDVEGDDGG